MKKLEHNSTEFDNQFDLDEIDFNEPKRNSKIKYICYAFYALIVYSYIELYGVDFYRHIICVDFFKSIGIVFAAHAIINVFNNNFRTGVK